MKVFTIKTALRNYISKGRFIWWSRRESNPYLKFRKLLFYPLNYETNAIHNNRIITAGANIEIK